MNAEPIRTAPFRAGWSGSVDASLALQRGNVETLDASTVGRVQYQTLHPRAASNAPELAVPYVAQRAVLIASARYADVRGEATVSRAFAHARWTGMWDRSVGTDLFAQVQYDAFLHLELRVVTGLGARLELVHLREVLVSVGTAYMLEHDRIDIDEDAPDPRTRFEHRWANSLTLRLSLFDDGLLVQSATYYQPRFDALDDFRLLEELEVLGRVHEAVALGATFAVLYDSAPPTGVRDTDVRLATTLR
ncbi:MAG: DUF481 domain-containing protein, partial [Gemmatimonadales bacterium]|nr:DUF481 domain-containing protein [Gemmatimonadales bacterium]